MNEPPPPLWLPHHHALAGCNIFEPRPAEDPTVPGGQYPPATDASTVISNLRKSVEERSVQNYVLCFSDPLAGRAFTFLPSSDGAAQYGSIFSAWSVTDEQDYFQNISARTTPTSASSLVLTERSRITSGDSVVVDADYVLTFEHTDPSLAKIARGSMQIALGHSNSNIWSIYRWADFKTTTDITWSVMKGKFSN
jgi:hypothetical protein